MMTSRQPQPGDELEEMLHRSREASKQGEPLRAVEILRKVVAIEPMQGVFWGLLGHSQLDAELYADAVASFTRACELSPDKAWAWSGLGQALQTGGRLEEAEQSLLKSLELTPESAHRHVLLAHVQSELHKYAEAEANLRKALSLEPDFDEAMYNLQHVMELQHLRTDACDEAGWNRFAGQADDGAA